MAIEHQNINPDCVENTFKSEFEKEYSHIYIATNNGDIVGFVIFWNIGLECEIINIAVDITSRGQGIGDKLLSFAIDMMGHDKQCFLEVDVQNDVAINMYKKHGFTTCGNIKDYYDVGRPAYRMVKIF